MRTIRSKLLASAVALAFSAAALAPLPARAQAQDNLDLGTVVNQLTVPLLQGASPAHTPGPANNTGANGLICTMNIDTSSGNPSTTFSIDFFDTASATWQALVTSGAITALNTPTSIMVYPGAVATSVPTHMVIAGLKLPVVWRVTETVTGSASGIYGSIGCNLLK